MSKEIKIVGKNIVEGNQINAAGNIHIGDIQETQLTKVYVNQILSKGKQHFQALPKILLTFANDYRPNGKTLRFLADEDRAIKAALEKATEQNICTIEPIPHTRAEDIFDAFVADQKKEIAIFHFGGHAQDFQLLLEKAKQNVQAINAEGLLHFIARQDSLKLVFLNACSTAVQAERLIELGVPIVIATDEAIRDDVARDLAIRFYKSLGAGRSIGRSWEDAKDYVRSNYEGDQVRALYFDGKDHSDFPWRLHIKAGAEQTIHWTLSEAAQQPLFGLPELGENYEVPNEPYRFLKSYQQSDARIFFGRNRYIKRLYQTIEDPQSSGVLLLNGQSGVGKSSLIRAGLLPRLEAGNYQTLFIRRDATLGLHQQLLAAFEVTEKEDLWTKWQQKEQSAPLVVLLDQVEEVFIQSQSNANEWLVLCHLIQQVWNRPLSERPKGKLILSFRKEYYADISKTFNTKNIHYQGIALDKLDRTDIIEIVEGLESSEQLKNRYQLEVEDDLAAKIADLLLQDPKSAHAPVLQIILTKLWQSQAGEAQKKFELPQFEQLRKEGILLKDFFDQQMNAIKAGQAELADSGLALDILRFHTTDYQTAQSRDLNVLRQQYAHRAEVLETLNQQLSDFALLSSINSSTQALAHDTLASIVQEEVQISNRPGQRAFRILQAKTRDYKIDDQTIIEPSDLALVEDGKNGMRLWTEKERKLVEKSRAFRTRLEQNKKRSKTIGIVLLLLLLLASVWAIINDQKSRKQTKVSGLIGEALLTEKNDSKQALPIIEKALQILPNDPNALQTRHDIWSDNEFYDLVLPHPHPVEAVRIAPNDSIILTAAENVIYQWAKTGDLLGRIKHNTPITDLCYSKDGQSILFGTQGNTAELYTSDGRKINSFPHPDWVNAVAFSPNNQSILTAGRDGIARVFDLSGELLLELTGHQASLTDIAFSKNGDKILTTSADGLLLIWNQEGTILDSLEKQASKVLSGTFARTSNQILSSNRSGVATIWNTDGTIAARLKGHEKAINTAQFLKQDRYVLTASNDDQIKLWDHMGNVLKTYKGHRNDVSDLTVSNTGHWFTSAGADSTARIWRLTSKVTHSFGQHENEVAAMAVSKDGNYILTASGGGVQAELDDVNDLATDNFDDLMFLLEATNPQSAYLWNKEGKGIAELLGHKAGITAVDIHPDTDLLLTASEDQSLRLWDMEGKAQLNIPHESAVNDACFSPDGQQLLSADENGLIQLWTSDGTAIAQIQLSDALLPKVTYSADGQRIFISDYNGKVHQTDANLENEQLLFEEESPITCLSIAPQNDFILTGHLDQYARLWSADGRLLQTFFLDAEDRTGGAGINAIAFSDDETQIAVAAEGGLVQIFSTNGTLLYSVQDALIGEVDAVRFVGDGVLLGGRDGMVRRCEIVRQ